MRTSTDIRMHKSVVPVFPDKCVVCELDANSTTKITQNSQHPLSVFFMPLVGVFGWSRVEFPICKACKPRFYFQRWGRDLICWLIVIAAFFIAIPYFEDWSSLNRRIAVGLIAFIALLPYGFFEVFVPRSFGTSAGGGMVSYEFGSQPLGLEFYALNQAQNPHSKIDLTIGDE